MLALLLTLIVSDPTPADLDRLQGVWIGDNETTLTIRGTEATLTSLDGFSQFTAALQVCPGQRILRLVDRYGTSVRTYRLDGRRLYLGEVIYTRQPFLVGTDSSR